jgi:PAS domain S-box-containing protein
MTDKNTKKLDSDGNYSIDTGKNIRENEITRNLREIVDYKYALDESAIVAITDQKGIIKHVNNNFCKISKYSAEELIGQDHRIINSGYHPKEFIRNLWVTIANGKIWKGELKNRAKDGSIYWVDTTIVPFLDEKGKPYQYLAIRSDITYRKKAEENLEKSLKEVSDYQYALDESSIVSISDKDGIITHVNENSCKISKYTKEELIGQNHRIFNSGYHSKQFFGELWNSVLQGKIWRGEIRNKAKDGSYFWVDATVVPFLDENKKPYQYVAIKFDITARIEAEEIIKAALREKEVLLRELYHRTKNNMQVISSILNLKAATLQDEKTIEILEDMGNRIKTMAMVHQKLYQSQDLSSVDLKEYIKDISGLLISSYASESEKIKLTLNLESIHVSIDTAIPCGLIVNEIITNSLKHAFPGGREGEIYIRLFKQEDGLIELEISDNGIGIPAGYDFEAGDTLGIQVFKSIAEEQMNGEIQFDTKNGVKFIIRFKENGGDKA